MTEDSQIFESITMPRIACVLTKFMNFVSNEFGITSMKRTSRLTQH